MNPDIVSVLAKVPWGLWLLSVAAAAAVTTLVMKVRRRQPSKDGSFGTHALLSRAEQAMFWRLTEALPEHVVLAQVSFGALLTAKRGTTRNYLSQKRADFVVTDRAFQVLAIVELDDSSHRERQGRDADRERMLSGAGYRVVRYGAVPDASQIALDFAERHLARRSHDAAGHSVRLRASDAGCRPAPTS